MHYRDLLFLLFIDQNWRTHARIEATVHAKRTPPVWIIGGAVRVQLAAALLMMNGKCSRKIGLQLLDNSSSADQRCSKPGQIEITNLKKGKDKDEGGTPLIRF